MTEQEKQVQLQLLKAQHIKNTPDPNGNGDPETE